VGGGLNLKSAMVLDEKNLLFLEEQGRILRSVCFKGLLLEINVEQEQYLGPLTVEAGIRVLLHGQGEMVFPFEEGFSVSPGMSTSVWIKKVRKNACCLDLHPFV